MMIKTYLTNLQFAQFLRKWNGALFAPLFFVAFLICDIYLLGKNAGTEYAALSFTGLIIGACKLFFAEFIASMTLWINQRDYFLVIHEDNEVPKEKNTQSWRDSARFFYALYFIGAALIMAFA